MARRYRDPASEFEKYKNWLKNLKRASQTRIVLCQKKPDADLLKSLGISNTAWLQLPQYKTVEALSESGRECILLFNVNKRSNELCERTRALLEEHGVKVSTRFRKLLLSTELAEVSNLKKYIAAHLVETKREI